MSNDRLLENALRIQTGNAERAGANNLFEEPTDDLFCALANQSLRPELSAAIEGRGLEVLLSKDLLYRDDDTLSLGKRIFDRWSRAFHQFLCSSEGADEKVREDLLKAIFSKGGGSTALLAGGMAAAFGIPIATAAIVSALIMQLIVAPAATEICATWETLLDKKRETTS